LLDRCRLLLNPGPAMNGWQEALRFILFDGTLLLALFVAVTLLVFLAQQLAVGRSIQQRLATAGVWRGAGLAAVGGAVTPFCSCSTVPVLGGMLRSRIRLGACFSFLIASPVINEGVIILLASGIGLLSAIVFVPAAALICVVAGVLVERLGMRRFLRQDSLGTVELPEGYLGDAAGHAARAPLGFALRLAWGGARIELRRLLPYVLAGIVVGGLIYGFVPDGLLLGLREQFPVWWLIPLAAVVASPLYVSPMAAVPVGFALLEKGMPPGVVIAFLIAGAGTSLPEMIMLGRLFRWPLILAHILAVLTAAVLLGFTWQWWMG
jgi:uncharacterized protein